jgi:hypothetical protein
LGLVKSTKPNEASSPLTPYTMPSYAIIPSENPPNPCANDMPFRNVAFLLPDCQIQLQTCPAAPSSRLKSIFKVLNASFGLLPMVVNRSRKSF